MSHWVLCPFCWIRAIVFFAVGLPLLFIGARAIIYTYYNAYKVITAKCQGCGKRIKGEGWKKIKFIYTPWRKPKFTCLSCQKKTVI